MAETVGSEGNRKHKEAILNLAKGGFLGNVFRFIKRLAEAHI